MSRIINDIPQNIQFRILLISGFLILTIAAFSQSDKKFIRKGNREYGKNKFSDSEILYRKAIDKNKQSSDALFNVGDALYKQNKFEEAGKQFIESTSTYEDRNKKSAGFYNLGNSLLKANKLQESIDAYKMSLKLKPNSTEAKYNLAYAQDMLKKQQEQQQKQQQQDKDKKDQEKKQEDKKKDQNKDQKKDQDQQKNSKDQQQQQQEQKISKEDAQRLLDALANDEKNVQEKVKLAKVAKDRVKSAKNW